MSPKFDVSVANDSPFFPLAAFTTAEHVYRRTEPHVKSFNFNFRKKAKKKNEK